VLPGTNKRDERNDKAEQMLNGLFGEFGENTTFLRLPLDIEFIQHNSTVIDSVDEKG
jgi:hypothetical protein